MGHCVGVSDNLARLRRCRHIRGIRCLDDRYLRVNDNYKCGIIFEGIERIREVCDDGAFRRGRIDFRLIDYVTRRNVSGSQSIRRTEKERFEARG